MLAQAFIGRPFTGLLGDDPAARLESSRVMFAGLARYGLAYGAVHAIGCIEGVAIWLAPQYVEMTEERLAAVGLADGSSVVGDAAWKRILAYDIVAARLHEQSISGPHWYLSVIGVAPEVQGRGLAGALLSHMYERLDGEHLPAYLDTNVSENVAFYQRRGFRVVAQAVEPASGILIRGMLRAPGPAGRNG